MGNLCPRGQSLQRNPPWNQKSGRYASYWNAFLFTLVSTFVDIYYLILEQFEECYFLFVNHYYKLSGIQLANHQHGNFEVYSQKTTVFEFFPS